MSFSTAFVQLDLTLENSQDISLKYLQNSDASNLNNIESSVLALALTANTFP